jgi:glycosyltransferase involved in cell wall biosynthesis
VRILLTADPELPVPPKLYGGIERIIDVLVRKLVGRGHEVALCAHGDSTTPAHALYAWPSVRSRGFLASVANLKALRTAYREWAPDIVHSFGRLAYLAPILPTSTPKIMSYQRDPSLRTTRWARRLSRGTLTFTGCSENICRLGRRGGGRWTAIHNCVETDRLEFREQVASDAPLVFLSRIERIKGTHTAIAIAKKAGRRLVIAGNHGSEGEAGEYWRAEIEPQLGRDGVEYVGPVDDVAKNQLLGHAAAMVVPIEWEEPFGIVFAESLACGTPVVSCARGALPEIVDDGVHGFLIGSVEEGVAAVGRLGEISRRACRDRAEACFSADAIVGRYEFLYAERLQPARFAELGHAT